MITTIYHQLYFHPETPSAVYQITDNQNHFTIEILGTHGMGESFILAPAYWLCCSINDKKNRNIGLMDLTK